mgnify:CR=1 FL=1
MLHTESWQGGQKGFYSLVLLLSTMLHLVSGCTGWEPNKNRHITMEAFSELKAPAFVFNMQEVRKCLHAMATADGGKAEADRQTRAYYKGDNGYQLVWVDRMGVTEQADSLLSWLHMLDEIGFSEKAFQVADIERDLKRMRALNFDERDNTISRVASRLDYRLTKACARYCYGQRFGFTNPNQLFNHLEVEKEDSLHRVTKYRGLFDVEMDIAGADYFHQLLQKVRNDSLSFYLHEIQPSGKYYEQLKRMLPSVTSQEERQRVLVNMERARWRRHKAIAETGKRIIVNIPSYHLYAYGADSVLDMRVVCGAVKTKTPQLSSDVEYMEVNPRWVIPMSIIKNEVSHRAGNSDYFARHRYRILNRETGKEVSVSEVSSSMLNSGKYAVAQDGGRGNSLGRIVFRFKNRFSVFLHDTSSPGAFQNTSRAISHGCVRVSKPFELAEFVLEAPDDWLLDRIRIAMDKTAQTDRGRQYVSSHPDEKDRQKVIGYVPVKPHVPLYIIYNTLWYDQDDVLQSWPDVYGYDKVLWQYLQIYTE